MLRCGKHKGQRFVDIARHDRLYCAWVVRDGGPAFGEFAAYLRSHHGGILHVGKYKGHFYDEVTRLDPEYCEWALSLIDPGPPLYDFIEYVRAHATNGGKQETAGESHEPSACACQCKICCSETADHALTPCGHVLCGECASRLHGDCPFCRTPIGKCVKLYMP